VKADPTARRDRWNALTGTWPGYALRVDEDVDRCLLLGEDGDADADAV